MMQLFYNQKRSEEFFEEVLCPYSKDFVVSSCIIDLSKKEPEVFGYRMDEFVYPASCYKVFVGAEVLRRVETYQRGVHKHEKDFSLQTIVEISSPNDVDKDTLIFPEDDRPLLRAGDKKSVDSLLDLMLTRSDNTATNCLIDLVSRESLTENIIYHYGWVGSEVTRKFLDRSKEEESYRFSKSTMSCARHLAEFFFLVEKNEMISSFVSEKLKSYMMKRNSARGFVFHAPASFCGKSGWFDTNLWKSKPFLALKNILRGKWAVIRWSHDVGVVQKEDTHFVICVMSISKSWHPWHRFPIKKIGDEILDFMKRT